MPRGPSLEAQLLVWRDEVAIGQAALSNASGTCDTNVSAAEGHLESGAKAFAQLRRECRQESLWLLAASNATVLGQHLCGSEGASTTTSGTAPKSPLLLQRPGQEVP